jgi:16S rRNA (cytidine1402-2'-O)-methyltransferase
MPVAASAESPDDPRDGQSGPLRGLVLVSTPIGNLGDISARARAGLATCDLILCEDTRRTGRLLTAMAIHTRTDTLHDHNEDSKIPMVLGRLLSGQTIGLVSDAGTPLVSDPGYRLVRAVIAEGLPVSAIPGPNAAITALILSLDFRRRGSRPAVPRSARCGRPSALVCRRRLSGTKRRTGYWRRWATCRRFSAIVQPLWHEN